METRHVSAYYTKRCRKHRGHYKHRYPKLSAVCDTRTHLILSAFVDRGPKPDYCEFDKTITQPVARQPINTLVGDAGYESEAAHRLCRHQERRATSCTRTCRMGMRTASARTARRRSGAPPLPRRSTCATTPWVQRA